MAQKQNKTYVGTELKMHIGFSYPGVNMTLDDLNDFNVDFYCEEGMVQHFEKDDLIQEEPVTTGRVEHEYYAPVDTTKVGPGELKMKLTAYIND